MSFNLSFCQKIDHILIKCFFVENAEVILW